MDNIPTFSMVGQRLEWWSKLVVGHSAFAGRRANECDDCENKSKFRLTGGIGNMIIHPSHHTSETPPASDTKPVKPTGSRGGVRRKSGVVRWGSIHREQPDTLLQGSRLDKHSGRTVGSAQQKAVVVYLWCSAPDGDQRQHFRGSLAKPTPCGTNTGLRHTGLPRTAKPAAR